LSNVCVIEEPQHLFIAFIAVWAFFAEDWRIVKPAIFKLELIAIVIDPAKVAWI